MTRDTSEHLGADALAVWLCMVTVVTCGGCAARQPARTFSELQQRVKSGQVVYVIDDTGTETKGRVLDISTSDLTLDVDGVRRPMASSRVRQVQRYGDSLWNGLLIGVAVGTPVVLISDPQYEPCRDDPQQSCADMQAGQRVLALAVMGALGAGIDALIRGRHQIYLTPGSRSARRIMVSPRLGRSAVSLFFTLDLNRRSLSR